MSEGVWPEPAYVIRSERVMMRCYERGDARRLHQEVLDNVDALRPWMPWIAHEPLTIEDRVDLLRNFRARFDAGADFIYGMFDPDGERLIGGCGLHPRVGPDTLEIGYWVVKDRWGQGLGSEVAAALTRVGFERMRALKMEIRVSPRNDRSLAIPRKLGYLEEGRLRGKLLLPDGTRDDLVVFGMLADEFIDSPYASTEVELEGF